LKEYSGKGEGGKRECQGGANRTVFESASLHKTRRNIEEKRNGKSSGTCFRLENVRLKLAFCVVPKNETEKKGEGGENKKGHEVASSPGIRKTPLVVYKASLAS